MKKLLDRLNSTYNIIEKRFSKDDDNYELFICGCFCLLGKFGEEFEPLVENVFNNTNFIISEGNTLKLAEENEVTQISFNDISEEESEFIDGLSYNGIHFYFNNEGKVFEDFSNPVVVIPTNNKSRNDLLNTFIHEVSHLIKSQINSSYCEEYNYYFIRSGLSFYEVNYCDGKIIDNSLFSVLDEVINVVQTTEMMKDLRLLKEITCDENIKNYLNEINFEELDLLFGYDGLSDTFVNLWNNEEFRNIIERDIVIGDLDKIVINFNNIMGKNCFYEFSNLWDNLEDTCDLDKYNEIENKIKYFIGEFNKRTNCQYKK